MELVNNTELLDVAHHQLFDRAVENFDADLALSFEDSLEDSDELLLLRLGYFLDRQHVFVFELLSWFEQEGGKSEDVN